MERRDTGGAVAECLSDYEDRLERGEAPDLELYRDRLAGDFEDFSSVLEARAAIFDVIEPAPPESLPREFGPYTLVRVLGRGGAGVVYEARNNRLGRTEAVKVLHPEAGDSRTAIERFDREARACARTNHPHVVSIYQSGEFGGRPYFAMEFVDGPTLKQMAIDGGPRDVRAICGQLASIVDALHALHQEGVVHRDVKPSNIMVRPDGTYVLMDFGLIKDDFLSTLTQPNQALGTPYYMSPEQMRGDRVTPLADVYSVGATLYHVLAGESPFEADSIVALASKVCSEKPRPLTRTQLDVPDALNRIVMKCLEKEPGDRYADAAALCDDLRAFANGDEVVGRPIGWPTRALRTLRRRALPIGLAAAVVAGLGIAWTQRGGTLHVTTSGFVAQLEVDGTSYGSTPQAIEVAKGLHRLTFRTAHFRDFSQFIPVKSGSDVHVSHSIGDFAPLVDNRVAMRKIGALLGIDIDLARFEDNRGGHSDEEVFSIVHPRGDARVQDLTSMRVEINGEDEDFPSDARVVLRKVGGEILGQFELDANRTTSVFHISENVRSAVQPGDVLLITFEKLASAQVRIVAEDADLTAKLDGVDEELAAQPAWVRGYFRGRLLIQAGLHQAALVEGLAAASKAPESLLPHLIVRSALAALGQGGSRLAHDLDEKLEGFPQSAEWIAQD